MRRTLTTALAATSLLVLAACGTSQPSADESDEPSPDSGPITLTDGAGRTVELPGPAEKVVSLEWQMTEDLLALGVDPVGVADVKGYSTWNTAESLPADTTDVGLRGEPNYDAIYQSDPDLVVLEVYGPDDAVVKRLEKYDVPVLAVLGADAKDPLAQLKETFTLIAQAVGKEGVAEDVLAELDQSIEDAKTAVADATPETTDFVYADAYAQGSTISIRPYGQGSLIGELGETIGLTNAWTGEVDPAYGLGSTDVEGIAQVGDVHLFYTGTESGTWLDKLSGNPVWEAAPFVTNDRFTPFPEGIWTFGGPRSAQQVVDAFVAGVA
ncbi:iron-siderophore ABC transporter substrate-binding protein [Nocardioides sp. cx-169]|uniref:ABC transporter substrate-binding protein n=1 Tax=Nocardioides sp. cx-169 TaxID=2899080 RepID=UPI001E47D296|nr:iron-siderophore ABC transporter substrate-binding protein [Nocardioides sp. cx-169]MCD4533978.1 iron-siderophore ABC transporter substrate-binding protein [Nocardioides sp. cx-169]